MLTSVVRNTPDVSRTLVVAARPDACGLDAARVMAARLGGVAVHAGEARLERRAHNAAQVVVLDPPAWRARLTRDRAFTAAARAADRRALLRRLSPYRDRVRWLTGPA